MKMLFVYICSSSSYQDDFLDVLERAFNVGVKKVNMLGFYTSYTSYKFFIYLFMLSLLRVTHFSDKHCFPSWLSFTQYIKSWTKLLIDIQCSYNIYTNLRFWHFWNIQLYKLTLVTSFSSQRTDGGTLFHRCLALVWTVCIQSTLSNHMTSVVYGMMAFSSAMDFKERFK